jgi:hypothetical protein
MGTGESIFARPERLPGGLSWPILRDVKSISMTGTGKFITAATLLACSIQPAGAANSESSSGPLHSQSGEERRPTNVEEEDRSGAVLKEYEFVRRFNNLFSALLSFASNYNTGHVIDAKRAKAVRKALRDLEKSEWFNPRTAE